ncbi:hypothetical protein [Ectothiorhodospira mobilis]|uniref:hypothetical protein n=1 Tax=Ectothiorhodospira mobilis TaxID=195064 RepID=UPI001907B522|nr:hypothetical protein [Ectothiorhodospira mobilis]MBK1690611.1 hypothetical protein [Ectothiorhodospira mobilis]
MMKERFLAGCMVGLLCAVFSGSASAGLIVDRGLPDSNLNNGAGSDRSNVAWDLGPQGGSYIAGDDFTIPCSEGRSCGTKYFDYWRIDRVTVWGVAGGYDSDFQLGDRYDTVSLFLGPDQGEGTVVPRVATSSVTGDQADAENIEISRVDYPNNEGVAYQGSGGGFIQIWEFNFDDLGLFREGNFLFGLDLMDSDGESSPYWFNHASNAALSGTPQEQSDDRYNWYAGNADMTEIVFGGMLDSNGFGWDKSSDINIQVYATYLETRIPEPNILALFVGGGGLLLVMLWGRRSYPRC